MILVTNLRPGYQRDDWRGVARSLPASTGPRLIVGAPLSSAPLSIYLGPLVKSTAAGALAREVAFVALRTRRTGHAPAPPVVPLTPPPGFRLLRVTRSDSFAVATFVSAQPRLLSTASLRRLDGSGEAEVTESPHLSADRARALARRSGPRHAR